MSQETRPSGTEASTVTNKSQQKDDLTGHSIGKYQLRERLGHGQRATVYRAHDPFMDREVAVKIAHSSDQADNSHADDLFFNEAQAAGSLNHPNIIEVYDAGIEQGHHFIVMELADNGRTLSDFTQPEKLLDFGTVTNILYDCAMALDYAHGKGVVHRDIKPRNIFLNGANRAKLSAFVIATAPSAVASQLDLYAGTPRYMSPEQIKADAPLGHQTDFFSLGIVAYELLAGRHPFHGTNLDAIRHRITSAKPTPVAELRAGVPQIFQRIIDKSLAKNLSNRYARGVDVAGDLALVHDFIGSPTNEPSRQDKFSSARKIAFFDGFNDRELWEIVNAAVWLEFKAGDNIIAEGDQEPAFYIAISGNIAVNKGTSSIVSLGPGDCFGEMGLVRKKPRTATIVAATKVTALKLNGSVIERASINSQLLFQKKFLYTLIDRLDHATEMIARQS